MDDSHKRMLHAAKWNTASNILTQVLSSGVTLVLAALLSPAQFGIVAIAYIYITFIQQITGFGFNSAVIQHKALTDLHLSSVFWLNTVFGCILAVLSIVLSNCAVFLNFTPELTSIICAASISIPIEALSVVQIALLQREMRFKQLAIRDNLATSFGGVVGIVFAFLGYGAWALVFQHIASDLIALSLLWRLSKWRPKFSFSWAAVRTLANYAIKTFIGRLGTFAQNNTDSLFIGIIVGPGALGIYRLASRLIEMNLKFLPRAIQVVSLPHFSKFQSDFVALNRQFLFGTHINAMVTYPTLSFMAGSASLILKSIGPQWTPAETTLQILAIIGIAKTTILLVGPLLQSVSRPGILSANLWLSAAGNIGAVFLSVRLFPHATDEQQIAYVASFRSFVFLGIFLPLLIWNAKSATGLSIRSYIRTSCSGLITAAIVFIVTFLIIKFGFLESFKNKYIALTISAIIALFVWIVCLWIFERSAYIFVYNFVRNRYLRPVFTTWSTAPEKVR